jgi:heme-degrading monooxygenase HmoA
MICRVWSGRARSDAAADTYQHVFETTVLDDLRGIEGFQGAYLLRAGLEVRTLTMFDSLDAIRAFAGEHYEQPHVTPQAQAVLAEFDREVRHFTAIWLAASL